MLFSLEQLRSALCRMNDLLYVSKIEVGEFLGSVLHKINLIAIITSLCRSVASSDCVVKLKGNFLLLLPCF